jgi:hypothetical protein
MLPNQPLTSAPSVTRTDIPITRLFNALTGSEAKAIMKAQFAKILDGDQRFANHRAFPVVQWQISARLHVIPSEDLEMGFDLTGGVSQVDEAGQDLIPAGEWNGGFDIRLVGTQGVVRAPDELREAHRLDLPHAHAPVNGPIYESRRVNPADRDAREAVTRMAERGDPMAGRLAAAQRERPHKVVETSPLANGPSDLPPREMIDRPVIDNRLGPRPQHQMDPREGSEPTDPRGAQQQAEFAEPPPVFVELEVSSGRPAKPLVIRKGGAIEARAQEFKDRGAPEGNKTFGGTTVEPPVEMPVEPSAGEDE